MPDSTPATQRTPGPSATGLIFGGYEVGGEIGRGGMGIVYRARQTKLNRMVALMPTLSPRRGQGHGLEAHATSALIYERT